MPRLYLPSISDEDQVALICIGVILALWVIWGILIRSGWSEHLRLFEFEEWLWRRHGVSASGIFFMMLIMTVILYAVWFMLGRL